MEISYAEIDDVYKSMKQSRNSKISIRTLTNKLLLNFEIDTTYQALIETGVKTFFRRRDATKYESNEDDHLDFLYEFLAWAQEAIL